MGKEETCGCSESDWDSARGSYRLMDLETSKAEVEVNHQAHLGCLTDIHYETRFNYHSRYALAPPRAESYAMEELIQSAYSQD